MEIDNKEQITTYLNGDRLELNKKNIRILDNNCLIEFKFLTYIDLSENNITSLDKYTFNGLNNLTELHLNSNQIESLDPNIFNGLNKLERLYLNSNRLKSLDPNIFNGLNNLETINLGLNHIESLDKSTFNGLCNLRWLYLNTNLLTSLVEGIFNGLTKLLVLNVSSNKLDFLDKKIFDDLCNLLQLDLSSNQLTKLNEKTFNGLINLQRLYLNSNKLIFIDECEFYELKKLCYLDLRFNQIKSLKKDIFNGLNNLETLNLCYNLIESLDANFFKELNSLSFINLSLNQIVSLDKNIFNGLNNLQNVDLSSNKIKSTNFLFSAYSYKSLSLNLRFNRFKTDCEFFKNKFNFIDLRNNLFAESQREELKKTYAYIQVSDESNDLLKSGYVDKLDFNNFIDSSDKFFDSWNNIPMFSVLAGNNDFDKSSLLNYIENSKFEKFFNTNISVDNYSTLEEKNRKVLKKNISYYTQVSLIKPLLVKLNTFNECNDQRISKIQQNFNYWKFFLASSILSINNLDLILKIFSNRIAFLNEHLNSNGCKYELSIENETLNLKINNIKVKLTELSPGEQLILQLYIWEFILTRFSFNEKMLLLLDQPDTDLHPKAVHELISILQKVCMAGAQIIMTTHNPTTVSFVDKKNLFVIRKYPQTQPQEHEFMFKLENDSKANIISELAKDVLKVKLIYVEGILVYDYFTWIKMSISRKINIYSQIKFETLNKESNQGCDVIREVLSTNLKGSVFDHFGIVDNDNIHIIHEQTVDLNKRYFQDIDSDDPKKRRRVLNIERYSIKNYILDPVYFFFYLNSLSKFGDQLNNKYRELKNDIVNDLVHGMLPNGDLKSDKLKDIVQDLINDYLTINDIYLNADDDKIFSSNQIKEKVSQLENDEFKISYIDFCNKLMTSIAKNVSYFLFDYLIKYNERTFSFRIFDGVNDKQVAFKLIDLFYYLPNSDKINSVEFLCNILQNFDSMGNRLDEEIRKTKDTDITILNLDDLKGEVFTNPTVPIIKNYLDVCQIVQNEQNQKISKVDEFKANLIKNRIVRENLIVDSTKIDTLFNVSDTRVKDKIEFLIREFVNSKEKDTLKTTYSNLTFLINTLTNEDNFLENFDKDKNGAVRELKNYLIKHKLYETKLIIDTSEKNELLLELNTVLNSSENQYENIKNLVDKILLEFNSSDIIKIIKSTKSAARIFKNCKTLKSIIRKDVNQTKKRLHFFIKENKSKTDNVLINKIKLLDAFVAFMSSDDYKTRIPLDDLITKLKTRDIINNRQEIDHSKLNKEQKIHLDSLEKLMKLHSCHKQYSNINSDFEKFKKKFNLTTNDSIHQQLHEKLIENNLITQNLEIIEENFGDESDFQIWKLKEYLKIYRKYVENKNDHQILKDLKQCSFILAILFDIEVDFYQTFTNSANKFYDFKDFENYFKFKKEMDKQLIQEIERQLLDETVKCYFINANEDVFIEYPKIFYRLSGDCIEYILNDIFFKNSKLKRINLCEEVFENIIKQCDRFIPREMQEIFLTIDRNNTL